MTRAQNHRIADMPLKGHKILVVEDEVLILMDLKFMLENVGAVVSTATSVGEGLAAAARPYDAAILDVRLSDGDVFPVASALDRASVRIIFHSGHANLRVLQNQFPKASVLMKPATESDLMQALLSPLPPADQAGL